MATEKSKVGNNWSFLTNHSHVILCLSQNPEMKIKDIAVIVGITERAVQRILAELAESEYINVTKTGRCNNYTINDNKPLKHPQESHRQIADLINLIFSKESKTTT